VVFSSNRLCFGNRERILPTAQPVNPTVFSIDPHPDHDAAVVPPQRRSLPQDPAPPLQSGLSALASEAKTKPIGTLQNTPGWLAFWLTPPQLT